MSPLASFGSAQFSRMRRENGSPLTGQSAPSARRQRRIGWAALTYARRYALFTLVGIAGEDDLDAPDLSAPANSSSEPETPALKKIGRLNGRRDHSARRLPRRKLDPEASAALRERLAAELKDVNSAEEAAHWAHRVLGNKNSLFDADATCIEEAFRAKLAMFATDTTDRPQVPLETERPQIQSRSDRGKKRQRSSVIDKSVLALPETRRVRDRDHVRYVSRQSCLICGRRPADVHHLRFAQSPALGRKVSDEFTVPLCRGHHREDHRCGEESAWWNKVGIDPTVSARVLWLYTHPLLSSSDTSASDTSASV